MGRHKSKGPVAAAPHRKVDQPGCEKSVPKNAMVWEIMFLGKILGTPFW
jgi:hypothetical protein